MQWPVGLGAKRTRSIKFLAKIHPTPDLSILNMAIFAK